MAVSLDEEDLSLSICGSSRPPPRTDGKVVIAKMPTFTVFDAVFMSISMLTFVVDIGTDLNLVVRYFLKGTVIWASLTMALVIVPAVIIMILSMRWHLTDGQPVTKIMWTLHIVLWGIMYRYTVIMQTGIRARQTKDLSDYDELYRQQSDVCLLRLFESFMESAPQLVLQLYIMMSDRDITAWTAITAVSSMMSLGWGIAAYTKAMRNTRQDKHKMTISGLLLQTVWRVGMIGARVTALAVAATVLEGWMLLVAGLHLAAMFVWVVNQKTGFSPTKWEESIFNFIMAVTYCFCFFNLKEGHSRWRMLAFYVVTVAENIAFVIGYYFLSDHRMWLKYTCLGIVFGGTLIGLTCLVLYYRFFHPMGPLNPFNDRVKESTKDVESDGQYGVDTQKKDFAENRDPARRLPSMRRDVKYLYPSIPKSPNSVLSAPGVSLESSPTNSSEESPTSAVSSLVSHMRPSGVMCSIQDLLANVSCDNDVQTVAEVNEVSNRDDSHGSEECTKKVSGEITETSPSSLERTVTRELEIRLSSSNFHNLGQREHHQDQDNHGDQQSDQDNDRQIQESPDNGKEQHQSQDNERLQYHSQDESANLKCSPRSYTNQNDTHSVAGSSVSEHPSPNTVGIPHRSNGVSQASVNSVSMYGSQYRNSNSILRTSVRKKSPLVSDSNLRYESLPHLTASTVSLASNSQEIQHDKYDEPDTTQHHVPNVELAVIDRMHIIEMESSGVSSSESRSDYENVYESTDPRKKLPPKPANLVIENLNETQTTQSSVPHDYENICAININREMWGVRHWKTYSDIEDRIHDNSTVKERLQMLDSTFASSLYSDYGTVRAAQAALRSSIVDDSESTLSRSLPDLSTLRLETCIEEPGEEEAAAASSVKDDNIHMAVLNKLRANKPLNKSNSVDDIPNYETIWVGDVERAETTEVASQMSSMASKSSLVVTIGDVRAKESLCNLYYSTMSDLSFRYYSERMKKNNSIGSLASRRSTRDTSRDMIRAISVPDNKTLMEVSELIEEQRKKEEQVKDQLDTAAGNPTNPTVMQTEDTPIRSGSNAPPRRKFSILRERFEHPRWTPLKSPLKRRHSTHRRNSFQDRTAKALHAGMKVFRRPRVHVITPKKSDDKDTPRLKSPFKSRNPSLTPTIKRGTELPSDVKPKLKPETEGTKTVSRTPQMRTPNDRLLTKRTPKSSTPDDNSKPIKKKHPSVLDSQKGKELIQGPKTSTPEGNKQLPQISILSAVSSVVPSPPENVQRFNISEQQRIPLSENMQRLNIPEQQRIPLSENIRPSRISSKSLAMQTIQETECTSNDRFQSQVQIHPGISSKSSSSLKPARIAMGSENIQSFPYSSCSSLPTSQNLLSLKTGQSCPRDERKYSQDDVRFSGMLGLPQFQPDTRPAVITVISREESPHKQQNISISRIVLTPPQPHNINMQKSTLSPNSKIFSRRI